MKYLTFHTPLSATVMLVLLFAAMSCNTDNKEDPKDVAEEQNEAKFDAKQESDAKFLVNAAEMHLEEIRLGQLAQLKGTMTDTKDLGKMMEDAHRKLQNDLTALAKQKLISIPTTLTDNVQDAYKKLNDKSGNDFDKEYCKMTVDAHKDAISKFEKASNDIHDADIRAWVAATLPGLRTHLDHAIICQKKTENLN